MADLYVLDKNLNSKGIIDNYTSLIWADRYYEKGDCEVYMPATIKALNTLTKGDYLIKSDSPMVCIIDKIEIDTDVENGNYLIVTGTDSKGLLDRRVVWNTISIDGNVEAAVRAMVNNALGDTDIPERKLLKANGQRLLYLGASQGLGEVATEQVSYKNIGEKVREYCKKYKWGYKVYEQNKALYFTLYRGQDKSDAVVFSNEYENLLSSTYVEDYTKVANVALVAGEGEGAERARMTSGNSDYASTNRYEIYVDAKDISSSITYAELIEAYPSGTIVPAGAGFGYRVNTLDIPILDGDQQAKLEAEYPSGTVVVVSGVEYYRLTNIVIATMEESAPADTDTVTLAGVIYDTYILTRGQQKLAEYGEVKSFDGVVEPNTTFVFREDYDLGDVVTVENEYGVSVKARIVEVVEVEDNNGYSIRPKFDYEEISVGLEVPLLTQQEEPILAQDGRKLMTARSLASADGVKITELPNAGDLGEGHYFAVSSEEETAKVSYTELVSNVADDVVDDVVNNIPDASTTERGLVSTGVQKFGGQKIFDKFLSINYSSGAGYPLFYFRDEVHHPMEEVGGYTSAAMFNATMDITRNRLGFALWSPKSDGTGYTTKSESFIFPVVDVGRTTNGSYRIITTKNLADIGTIPITQGGTGATTAANARANLEVKASYSWTLSSGVATSFNIPNGSRHMVVVVGSSAGRDGLFLLRASSTGATSVSQVYKGSSLTYTNTTNDFTITASGGVATIMFITLIGDMVTKN